MLIVFNFLSLIVVAVAYGLNVLIQSMFDPTHDFANHTFWLLMVFLSCIAEGIGMRPRVYFLPLWMISIVISLASIFSSNKELIWVGVSVALVSLALGILLRFYLNKRRFLAAQKSLELFKQSKKIEDFKKAIFYPSYIYPPGVFLENHMATFYEGLQRKWYFKPKVFRHYKRMLAVLEAKGELSKNNLYLRDIFTGETQNGVPKYLIDQMADA